MRRNAPAASLAAALLALLTALPGCAAHEKAGDRASATGDWRVAEREYARAVRDDPGAADLQAKHREALARALQEAQRKAHACAVAQDWECALDESQYALGLDPGDSAMAAVRRDAGREAGYLRLRRAGEALDHGESARAMDLLAAARAATEDPGVEGEARRLVPAAVRAAVGDADRYRASRQYPQAIDLLARAAQLDPGVGPRLEQVRAEQERWKDSEAERLAQEGDALLDARRLPEARARYEQAAAIRPQGRARDLARYAALVTEGDAALARRDFGAAERSYRGAAQSGLDRGMAREALERVEVRRWSIRLRWVRVRGGGPPGDLLVTAALPGGPVLSTEPRWGNRTSLEASLVVAANSYDDRPLTLRVLRLVRRQAAGDPPLDLGTMAVRISDLLAQRAVSLADGAVDELRVEAYPAAQGEPDLIGLSPPPPPPAPAPPPPPPPERPRPSVPAPPTAPPPAPTSTPAPGPRPAVLRAELSQGDARPGIAVRAEVAQAGRTLVSAPLEPRPGPALRFTVDPAQPAAIRLLRDGRPRPIELAVRPLRPGELEQGPVRLQSQAGTTVEVWLERERR